MYRHVELDIARSIGDKQPQELKQDRFVDQADGNVVENGGNVNPLRMLSMGAPIPFGGPYEHRVAGSIPPSASSRHGPRLRSQCRE